ncbi:MAG: hypothetical protein M1819_000742 [Sarea resinae]|nr:MAG: hypothetical protein M1819_000742 [Sarea resinae]
MYQHESRASLLGGPSLDRSYQPFGSGYHHREGLTAATAGRRSPHSALWIPHSKWSWSFVTVTFVQAAIALAFEGYVFAQFQIDLNGPAHRGSQARAISTYLTLFIFGFVYELLLVWDALRLKNTIQVIGLCIYNVGLLVYAAVQIDQIHDAALVLEDQHAATSSIWQQTRPFLVAVPCVLGLGTVLMSFIAWKLNDEFAWTIYKHISADVRMKRRYLTYQIYIALLKFDFFFFLGFTVQFVVIVTNTTTVEFALTIAAIPVTILILVMAAYWTRKESKPGMLVIIVLYFAALAYFLFKLVRMYKKSAREQQYLPARRSLTIFAVITVALIILTIINACICTANFNRGLKPHITTSKLESDDEKVILTEMPNLPASQVANRMVID